MQGAGCNLNEHFALLYEVRPVPTADTIEAGTWRHTWVTIGVDGTNRWNRTYVHCAVATPSYGSTHLAKWWLLGMRYFKGRCRTPSWSTISRTPT